MTDLNPPFFALFFKLAPIWFCFGCGCLLFRAIAARGVFAKDWRIAWAFTLTLMAVLCALIVEGAGAFRQLNRGTVLGAWLVVDAAMLAAALRLCRPSVAGIRAALKEAWSQFAPLSKEAAPTRAWFIALLALASALALTVGVVALQCPPNVWDSMTYHLPRVMHWIQQGSLAFYPTNILRQLESAPGAEQQTATLYLLSGDDWPLNLSQWWAMVTCAVMASLMAERLALWHFGAKLFNARKARFCGLFAAIIALTIPAGIPDAISTQNDYVATQWLMLFGMFSLLLAQEPGNRYYAVGVAASFALGLNNKPTMVINAAVFGLALGYWLWRKSPRTLAALAVASVVLTAAINFPWMSRNERLFHHPLGSQDTRAVQTLVGHAPGKLTANILRNFGLYASTPFAPLTDGAHQIFIGLFKLIGEDPQDVGSLWHDTQFGLPGNAVLKNDDGFGGMMTVLPLLLAAVFFLIKFKRKSPLVVYFGLILAGFALFCCYLRWQPWHQRLHLPFFMLGAPLAGLVLAWVWNRWCVLVASLLLGLNAILVLYYNFQYPIYQFSDPNFSPQLQTREQRYFSRMTQMHPALSQATAEVANDLMRAGVTNVLLKTAGDTWEYPLWVFLKDRGFKGTIQHAFVENESAPLGVPNLEAPGTAILCGEAPPPALAEFPLSVGCDSWTELFRGPADRRIRLIGNRFITYVAAPQAARMRMHFQVVDQNGRAVTNNAIQVRTSDFSREYPLGAEPVDLEIPLKAGQNAMGLFLVNLPSADQGVLELINVTN